MTSIYILIAFLAGLIVGFCLTAAGVAALIHDKQLVKTPRWYESEREKTRKKNSKKGRKSNEK